jgi:hypothetical protein
MHDLFKHLCNTCFDRFVRTCPKLSRIPECLNARIANVGHHVCHHRTDGIYTTKKRETEGNEGNNGILEYPNPLLPSLPSVSLSVVYTFCSTVANVVSNICYSGIQAFGYSGQFRGMFLKKSKHVLQNCLNKSFIPPRVSRYSGIQVFG